MTVLLRITLDDVEAAAGAVVASRHDHPLQEMTENERMCMLAELSGDVAAEVNQHGMHEDQRQARLEVAAWAAAWAQELDDRSPPTAKS